MFDCKKVNDIIGNADKENIQVEFKQFNILKTNKGRRKLLHEIIAFANKYGGHILIGIKNDGTFEGTRLTDSDEIKGTINNLIFTKIRPIITCEIKYVQCKEGDVILVNIPKKEEIPFAYVKLSNNEIINREYLIRTSHGIRHVSDRQLQYMFLLDSLEYNKLFRIVIPFNKKLNILWNVQLPPDYTFILGKIFANLPENIIDRINQDNHGLLYFTLEIIPYALLQSFSWVFQQHWNLKIEKSHQRILDRIQILEQIDKFEYKFSNLPDLPNEAYIKKINFDHTKYLKNLDLFSKMNVPDNLEIAIEYEDINKEIKLIMRHQDFIIQFRFFKPTGGIYLGRTHPQLNYSRNVKLYTMCGIVCDFSIKFQFPEIDFLKFKKYVNYTNNIKIIIKENWDYDRYIAQMPNQIHYEILDKLNKILK